MTTAPIAALILAAGMGTRMRSAKPKVLHDVAGRPMLGHVLAALDPLAPARRVVVVGPDMAAVRDAAADCDIVEQTERLGTADAVKAARLALDGFREGTILVLFGDTPLIAADTLKRMVAAREAGASLVVLGFEAADPTGYGRLILAPDGTLERIVEEKDASAEERAIALCNAGAMAFDADAIWGLVDHIGNDNAKGEFYLTDAIELAARTGLARAVVTAPEDEVMGVNSRADLAAAEALFQKAARARAMAAGATLSAPETVFFSADTRLGRDVTVGPNVVFAPGVSVADGADIRAFSHLEGAEVGEGAQIGPFARLRPGTRVGPAARVGNFVEVKNAVLGDGAKANHLAYLGDAHVGAGANIGAGTITCNYDGVMKHATEIGAGAFVGSNSVLIAPVTLGEGAIVGAGSAVGADVPADALALTRAPLEIKEGRAEAVRARKRAEKEAKAKAKAKDT